ncbi:MAG: glycoside hydrolase TIM-barrel-like domain-containing protein, partial [Pseudomonadota bacterium]
MATLVLQAAGQAAGGLLGPVGAIVGRAAGAIAGNVIDRQLFSNGKDRTIGRIDDVTVQTSSEGNPIARVYGRSRLAGEVIWATDFEEVVAESSTGGKGGGPKVREYSYFANFAVGMWVGPFAGVGRVWADGELLDLTKIEMRVYKGHADQQPDHLIEAIEGVAPAYRNLAYVVFERLPLSEFGNRLPQLTFEVIRSVGELESRIRAVTMIPGATEFGYDPERVDRRAGPGESVPDNRHTPTAPSDFVAALDELLDVCPNLERIALVVAWFGSDLRAGECELYPAVIPGERVTTTPWSVAGETRATGRTVSAPGGVVSYGGTPSDGSVVAAIKAIKERGLKVVFYPFILMDVPTDNALPDPYGGANQAPFPWRGRITLSAAPGQAGSPDGTAAADAEVAAFVGTASPAVVPAGEWSLRRMVMHYAALTVEAGGVDAFLVGSELRGLTTIRGANGFPFVDALSAIVDDVRSVVGPATKISYAADWTEYFGYQPEDGTVYYHLDPLWASPNVDFIGIDNYWPLSDWREGEHLDQSIASSEHDHAYLTANIRGGEGFDWYYANGEDRDAQNRSDPISDGRYGKDWVFRYKDLAGWWSNLHYERVDGDEVAQPTVWVPGQKPVWFTEVGCPAVSFGANQPNVFYDPKSSESALPYYSNGRRDDAIQRAYLTAMIEAFDPAYSSDIDTFNPVSSVYGGRMVEPSGVHAWTWDARPWPAFPQQLDVWSDGTNWERGHWLNGRMGSASFGDLVGQLFQDWGYDRPDVSAVPVVFDGVVVARATSLRSILEPLMEAASAVGADTGTGIRFVGLTGTSQRTFNRLDLVETDAGAPLVSETREEA